MGKKKDRKKYASRVHILMAFDSTKSLIIRRNPSKRMCTILWDREDNSFVAGDCITKIEERLSDISPDGKYIYYIGMTQKGRWSAIASTSSLRDMVFYRNEEFRCKDIPSSHKQYIYELYKYFMEIHPCKDSNPNNTYPRFKTIQRKFKKEEWDICYITAVYYRRLIRDGWSFVHHEGEERDDKYSCNYKTYFEKELENGWSIRKIAYDLHPAPEGKNGGHWDEHQLIQKYDDIVYDFTDWNWAERDEDYLYWTQKGMLYRISIFKVEDIESQAQLLCDINSFRVNKPNRNFTLDGDVDILRGLKHEESCNTDYEAVEYHYLSSVENGSVDACFYLGQYYLKQKKLLNKALTYTEKGFQRAICKGVLIFWHHEYYGDILYKSGDHEKAYQIFKSSLNYTHEDENLAFSYNYLGVLCQLNSKYQKAIEYFKKAVELNDSVELYRKNLLISEQK